ncbi:hypothetical protein HHK36_021991 [Tetracentron sinense]|uniref:Glycosyltransferase n=1 Tax=Tetracentron sinense TaxID=13715 RepID=A0A835D8H5_TETSI|nr:hypothetical protein HHK36_021991 [Tetracentron sinense]
MEKEEIDCKPHVLVFPFPAQGHINPMLQFSKRLTSKGIKVTLATTIFITKSMQPQVGSVAVESISDGFDDGDGTREAGGIDAYLKRFEAVGSRTLSELIEKQDISGYPINCLVYDSVMPWALDLVKPLGIAGASFFTQSCAVDVIYYHVHQGLLRIPVEGPTISLPGIPLLGIHDLPSFVYAQGSYPSLQSLVLKQFSNFEKADWLLFNTFDKLEEEVVNWMAKLWPIKTIGPTVPSMYLDKRVEDDKDYSINLFKSNGDDCMKWLNMKESDSVVYVSFGSLASLGEEQMEELAWGLKGSNRYFFWVVRASEENKLPSKFAEETSEKGLIVTWCPQLEVLAHPAVGCFVTHCGWNSTLEALSLGVPMVTMPQWTDQTTNAKFVTEVWKAGIRVRVSEKGIVRREEIEVCIREVMEGERGKEIRRNASKWKELAKEAVDEGGSSDKNIEAFVAGLVCD